VGHETDTTISDYVSDLRAPTPSAAAEIAVFDYNQYLIDLANCKNTMEKMLLNKVFYTKNKLENLKLRLENLNPVKKIQDRRIYLDTLSEKLEEKMKNNILKRRNKLSLLAEKLNGLSPLLKLDKGFAYISKNSKKINSTLELNKGDFIDISFKDGKAIAEIKKIMEEENERN
jgi:exodeoxyribonuclease VII large subunit